MTDNNKFIPKTQTYEVKYVDLKETQQQKPKLSLAARSKVVNNTSYVSSKSTDLVPSYGPCSTCGVTSKKFEIQMDLGNAIGNHLTGSADNTAEAKSEATDIVAGNGDWAGSISTGCFRKKNRKELVDKINTVINEHIGSGGVEIVGRTLYAE